MNGDQQFFELVVIEKSGQRTLIRLPAARHPWGTFSRGELFRLEGRYYPIDQVISQFSFRQGATVCSVILLVGPVLPESTLAEVAVPEAPPLLEAGPPNPGPRRRSWWGR